MFVSLEYNGDIVKVVVKNGNMYVYKYILLCCSSKCVCNGFAPELLLGGNWYINVLLELESLTAFEWVHKDWFTYFIVHLRCNYNIWFYDR